MEGLSLPIATPLDRVLRRPVESTQYTSEDYTQVLDDHEVLASIGSVGDCYDNALAESFVDSYKTELISDRVWRSHTQLELATVEYLAWFNTRRLHSSLGNIPPLEYEANRRAALASQPEGEPPPTGQLTLNAGGVYEPFGLVSAVR
jgi:putative transposase